MAYGLTKSANFVAASSQSLTKATDIGIAGNASLTMEAWIRVTANTNGAFMTHASTTGVDNYCWVGYNKNTPKIYVSSGYSEVISYSVTLTVGTWYHIGLTRTTANAFELFVNGTSVATGSVGAQPLATNIVSIGKAYNASEFFDGDISLVRYWNEIRTASQFSTNQCSVLGSTTNLKGEWTLDDVLTDNSGNGNTLTNNNTVTFTTALPSVCAVTDLSINTNDSITITESVTMEVTSFINVSDTITITESITAENTELGPISVSDTITITESVEVDAPYEISVFDSISISESVTVENTQLGNIIVNDSITITETVTLSVFPDQILGIAYMKNTDDLYLYNMRGDDKYSPPGMDDKAII